jgi:hypothetical protein
MIIEEVSLVAFRSVLEFLYTDTCTITADIAVELLGFSTLAMLDRLKCMCEVFLIKNIDKVCFSV